MLFIEEVASANDPPEQIGAIELNVGTVAMFTITVNVVVVAHCPASGVKL
jgi:hypothetical protein